MSKEDQLAELRAKHPGSSPEEIEALHAQIYTPHPDTSAANAELEAKRAKKAKKKK